MSVVNVHIRNDEIRYELRRDTSQKTREGRKTMFKAICRKGSRGNDANREV